MTEQVDVVHRWVDGPDVLTWFELRTATAGPIAIVNWSHVEAGRITKVRVTFDPRSLLGWTARLVSRACPNAQGDGRPALLRATRISLRCEGWNAGPAGALASAPGRRSKKQQHRPRGC